MAIDPIFMIMALCLLIVCIIGGCIYGNRMRRHIDIVGKGVHIENDVYVITKPCGLQGSQNSDIHFAKALENQSFSVNVTSKLIHKKVDSDEPENI